MTETEAKKRWWANERSPGFKLFLILVLVLIAFICSGCGATPYLEGGLYHTATNLNTHNPAFIGGAGVEWDKDTHQYQCEWVHYSHVTEGYPFNSRAEPYLDTFGCNFRYYIGEK